MNSAIQTLLKTLANLENQESAINKKLSELEAETDWHKNELKNLLIAKSEIQLAIKNLETLNDITFTPISESKKTTPKRNSTK